MRGFQAAQSIIAARRNRLRAEASFRSEQNYPVLSHPLLLDERKRILRKPADAASSSPRCLGSPPAGSISFAEWECLYQFRSLSEE
jgi:hypothetical protein